MPAAFVTGVAGCLGIDLIRERVTASVARSLPLVLLLLAPTLASGGEGSGGPGGPPEVARVSVSVETSRPIVGQTTQAYAELRDASGSLLAGRPVTWASDDDTIASVDAKGVVTARTPGTASITARSGGASGSVSVSVQPLRQLQPRRSR
jgi:hypothetical protein